MKKKELLCILAITALSTVFVGCTTNDNSNQPQLPQDGYESHGKRIG